MAYIEKHRTYIRSSTFTEIGTKLPFFKSQIDEDEKDRSFDKLKELFYSNTHNDGYNTDLKSGVLFDLSKIPKLEIKDCKFQSIAVKDSMIKVSDVSTIDIIRTDIKDVIGVQKNSLFEVL